jgi:hypothetical protein
MTAVRPILASELWVAESKSNSRNDVAALHDSIKIAVSATSINGILDGGFAYGQLHCITLAADMDTGDLINNVIVPHLLSPRDATATIVDSTLAFDVRRLYRLLIASMGAPAEEAQQRAMPLLERVKIMKVFDFAGLTEAVEEVRIMISARDGSPSLSEVDTGPHGATRTILDSDDEGEEEFLDEPPRPPGVGYTAKKNPMPPMSTQLQDHRSNLIIVRDISQVIGPLLRSNYTHGQAQLDSLMKPLGRLTRDHHACTIVLASASSRPAHEAETQLSQFESCKLRSALGDGLGSLVDVHIFRHEMPLHGTSKPVETRRGAQNRATLETVEVYEVVEDRYGGRCGRWAAVRRDGHGILCDVF